MVHWDTKESMMIDFEDMLNDIIDAAAVDRNFQAHDLEHMLQEYGFMIVPIEDPTNLRFGVE